MEQVNKENFEAWMERILDKLDKLDFKIDKTRNSLEGDQLLDNQDLCQLLKVCGRTLQRYRTNGILPYYLIEGKVHYKASDIHEFIRKHAR